MSKSNAQVEKEFWEVRDSDEWCPVLKGIDKNGWRAAIIGVGDSSDLSLVNSELHTTRHSAMRAALAEWKARTR